MSFAPRFRQGMKAAIPIWIAFVPSSLAWGIAAQAHGLTIAIAYKTNGAVTGMLVGMVVVLAFSSVR
jgi:predicted branched-subunit amino acid permease